MPDKIIVLTTWPDESGAAELAEMLVKNNLAACVNILPRMVSVYQWQGKLERGNEHQLVIKTRIPLYEQVESLITSRHPYELPEILCVPVTGGLPDYLCWIDEATHAE